MQIKMKVNPVGGKLHRYNTSILTIFMIKFNYPSEAKGGFAELRSFLAPRFAWADEGKL